MIEELEKLKKERDKSCKDYLELHNKVDEAILLLKDLMKKQRYQIDTNEYIYISLEQLSDLKSVLAILERK